MVSERTKQVEQKGGLLSYLAKLGLGDEDLARVFSLLQSGQGEIAPQPADQEQAFPELLDNVLPDIKLQEQEFEVAQPARPVALPTQKTINIFLAEEQQILKEAYMSFFSDEPGIEIVGSSDEITADFLVTAARAVEPDAMLLGVKTVQRETVEMLEKLRQACPKVGIVLLFAFYDMQGIKALREFSKDTTSGCAYLLKHTVDTVEQLTQVIYSVVEGRIIIDPMVMEGLIKTGDGHNAFLRELSPRELEVLSWMAKGYRNDTIADVLSRDVKTVERHINNIYSKLSSDREEGTEESRHPRVQAALTYLKATGLLPSEQVLDD